MFPDAPCEQIKSIDKVKLPKKRECEECVKIGARWVHLRTCQQCWKTLCCDDSPNKHATKHFRKIHHPIVRSFEPGEDWGWCYADSVGFEPAPEAR